MTVSLSDFLSARSALCRLKTDSVCILLSRLSLGSSQSQFGSSDGQQIRVAFWFGLGVQNQIPLLSEHTYTASKDDSDSEEYTECSFKA